VIIIVPEVCSGVNYNPCFPQLFANGSGPEKRVDSFLIYITDPVPVDGKLDHRQYIICSSRGIIQFGYNVCIV